MESAFIPDCSGLKQGDETTLRFVNEVKTCDKTYDINDWICISKGIDDYTFKNPNLFFKFYEKI